MENEIIVCSAILVENVGKKYDDIYLGLRHNDCFIAIKRRRELLTKDDSVRVRILRNAKQGFLTSKNRFVDRETAMFIARNNNQVKHKFGNGKELYSECLY